MGVERLEELGHEVVDRSDLDYGLVAPALVPRGMAGVSATGCVDHGIDSPSASSPAPASTPRWPRRPAPSGPALRAARAAEPSLQPPPRPRPSSATTSSSPRSPPCPRHGSANYDGRGYWATGGSASESCPFAFPWNVTGWPAISVPNGLTATGLPIGAQFLAPAAGEALLLSLAAQLEQDRRWHERHPPSPRG